MWQPFKNPVYDLWVPRYRVCDLETETVSLNEPPTSSTLFVFILRLPGFPASPPLSPWLSLLSFPSGILIQSPAPGLPPCPAPVSQGRTVSLHPSPHTHPPPHPGPCSSPLPSGSSIFYLPCLFHLQISSSLFPL